MNYVYTYNLDGVDIDWRYPTRNEKLELDFHYSRFIEGYSNMLVYQSIVN